MQKEIAQILAVDSGFDGIDQNDLDGMLQVEIDLAKIINDTLDEDDEQLRSIDQ